MAGVSIQRGSKSSAPTTAMRRARATKRETRSHRRRAMAGPPPSAAPRGPRRTHARGPLEAREGNHGAPRALRDQEDLARGLPALERAMCLGGLGQRELVLDAQLDLPVLDPAQDFTRPLDQLLARADVVVEAGPLQEERAAHVEDLEVERRHRNAGPAEEDHVSPRPESAQALVASRRAHAGI